MHQVATLIVQRNPADHDGRLVLCPSTRRVCRTRTAARPRDAPPSGPVSGATQSAISAAATFIRFDPAPSAPAQSSPKQRLDVNLQDRSSSLTTLRLREYPFTAPWWTAGGSGACAGRHRTADGARGWRTNQPSTASQCPRPGTRLPVALVESLARAPRRRCHAASR